MEIVGKDGKAINQKIETSNIMPGQKGELPFCPFAEPATVQINQEGGIKILRIFNPCLPMCRLWDKGREDCRMVVNR